MPKVLNFHKDGIPPNSVYVGRGRGSKWGNPFVIGKDGTREEVVEKYCKWIIEQEHLMASLSELKGKDLVCFCAPKLCHGDVLIELIRDFVSSSLDNL